MIGSGVDGRNRYPDSSRPSLARSPARLSPPGGLRRQVMTQRRLGTAALLAVLVAALLLTVPSLRDVAAGVGDMQPGWVVAAIALELASCAAFVAVFRYFFDRVEPRVARRVAWTELASGVLLPGGGVSSLAAGGWRPRARCWPPGSRPAHTIRCAQACRSRSAWVRSCWRWWPRAFGAAVGGSAT